MLCLDTEECLTGVSPGVSFQIERVVESLAAERAQVSLHIAVTLHVPVEQPLETETLRA